MEDVIVCGGGPAGLAAATWLGRYRRKTLMLDSGRQRNLSAEKTHGYLSRDVVRPQELLRAAREDLARYDTVRMISATAKSANHQGESFEVVAGAQRWTARRVVITTGVEDAFPDIKNFPALYGTSVFHCSCCDGYESRGQDVVAIGWGEHAAGFALDLLDWGARVTFLTHGRKFEGSDASLAALHRNGIEVIEETILELTRNDSAMLGARLASGRLVSATRGFFSIAHKPRNELARDLGCKLDDDGYVSVDDHGCTSVPSVYAAGDVTPGEQLVQAAAAQGAVAGIACALSLRGMSTASQAPEPGPDPGHELDKARRPR